MASSSFSRSVLLCSMVSGLTLPAISACAALVIADAATQNVVCASGLCTATATNAVLRVSDLETMLATSGVTVSTGTAAQDIDVQARLGWQGATALTLASGRLVSVSAALIVGTSQGLAITTYGGAQAKPGGLRFSNGGFVRYDDLSASLAIDGQPYTLVADVPDLAAGIAASPSGNFALAASYNSYAREGAFASAGVPTPFGGHFEGLGNTISLLKVEEQADSYFENAGLFASVLAGGAVEN